MNDQIIKTRETIVTYPPSYFSVVESKDITITKIDEPYSYVSEYRIEYEGAFWQKKGVFLDNEIEAFCSGVDAERERFMDMLDNYCNEDTIQLIKRLLDR
ncbi:hypothetical protein ACQKM9_17370 [Viridibacillus sp. NPDC093762]|uniref:hypothetical protein n=1 Tax=Viridibacillus sp. NPDC093762 TaxID=3390720 RepID=UPI003D046FC8